MCQEDTEGEIKREQTQEQRTEKDSMYELSAKNDRLNKEHWNTIIVDGTIPDKDICRMIAESYDLVTDSPTKRIYEAVKKIPKGQVATYGQVAELAG